MMEASTAHPTLSIKDVVSTFGISRSTIFRRINDGTLPVYRFGPRVLRFDPDDVVAAFRPDKRENDNDIA